MPGCPARGDYTPLMKQHLGAILLIIALACVGGLVAWQAAVRATGAEPGGGSSSGQQRVAVEVAPIEGGLVRDVRVLSGTLEASTRFDVAAKVGGLIEQLNVDIGDEVSRGQIVAVIDDDEFVQAVAEAEAELAVREAELAQARAELDRVMRDYRRLAALHERGVASELEFSETTAERLSQEAAVALGQARVRQAKATLELANIRLRYTQVRAAWQGGSERGAVGTRYEDAGNTVQVGDLIVSIVGLDPLKAVVSVTEGDYARLAVGQAATLITDARPGETFDATVVRIAPIFREASRQARVELEVANSERLLRPGMFIRLRVVLQEVEAETIVPSAAIVQRGGGDIVFTVDASGDKVTQHAVEVGIEHGERVQIISPALTGRVVVLGQHLLEDGAPITIAD